MTQKRLELGVAQGKLRTLVAKEGLVRQPMREKAYGVAFQPRALRNATIHKSTVERMGGVGDSANAVHWNKVNGAAYRRKFDALSSDTGLNELVHSEALRILKHRNNTDFEDLSILSRSSGKIVGRSTRATAPGQARYTDDLKHRIAIAKSNGDELIAIHNHPNGTVPSFDDIVSTWQRGYSKSIVVGHDGSLYTIDKIADSFAPYHYRETYSGLIRDGVSEQDAAIMALDHLRELGLIAWRKM
jgi:hypothetical protein